MQKNGTLFLYFKQLHRLQNTHLFKSFIKTPKDVRNSVVRVDNSVVNVLLFQLIFNSDERVVKFPLKFLHIFIFHFIQITPTKTYNIIFGASFVEIKPKHTTLIIKLNLADLQFFKISLKPFALAQQFRPYTHCILQYVI